MKVVTIVGARPQFIKAAAVSRAFAKEARIDEVIIHTGQHFDKNMSDIFFEEMHIPKPNYLLDINSLAHGAMTGRMLEAIEKILKKEKPDYILVYGDTNSTLAGALAAKKMHIKVIHVEAGLRSFNMKMPEEVNRILTDRISDILFCPTDIAIQNLTKEGFDNYECSIVKKGDVMEDAALYYAALAKDKSILISDLGLSENGYYLATCHRAENTDKKENLEQIVNALNTINKSMPVILPLHPRTKNALKKHDLKLDFDTIEPVGYFDMVELIQNAKLVLTDSGGLQKEAFIFNKYCITLREQTEWMELVNHQYNFLTGADFEKIIKAHQLLENKSFVKNHNFYGGGTASEKIIETLMSS